MATMGWGGGGKESRASFSGDRVLAWGDKQGFMDRHTLNKLLSLIYLLKHG